MYFTSDEHDLEKKAFKLPYVYRARCVHDDWFCMLSNRRLLILNKRIKACFVVKGCAGELLPLFNLLCMIHRPSKIEQCFTPAEMTYHGNLLVHMAYLERAYGDFLIWKDKTKP